ncbi:hypothetical protein ABEF95_004845 [Exophiala dermatitidis]
MDPSTSSAPSDRLIPELPNEILLIIVQHCPRVTLKNVRLASRGLAQVADPYLWRKVALVPNEYCIYGFLNAVRRFQILGLVTKLTYDARFGGFFQCMKHIKPDLARPRSEQEKASIESILDRLSGGCFAPHEDTGIEVAILSMALRALPNLREIRVEDYDDGNMEPYPTKIPQFYRLIARSIKVNLDTENCRRFVGAHGRSYTKGILTAAFSAGSRLQAIKLKNLDSRPLFGVSPKDTSAAYQQLRIFKNLVQYVHLLDLSFLNDTFITTGRHIESVQVLLKSARRVKTLKLRLTDYSINIPKYPDEEEVQSDLGALLQSPRGSWISCAMMPQLQALTIEACICHDDDLMHFLNIHASTLRRLELSNMTLLGVHDRRECWVKLIKSLKRHLKLTSISFSGWFSNGGRQQWFVAKDSVGTRRLKARVERYVVDSYIRECPLECVAIQPNESDVKKPGSGEEIEGDVTWAMVYTKHPIESMDWHPQAPSFIVSSGASSSPSPPTSVGDVNDLAEECAPPWDDSDEPTTILEDSDDLALPLAHFAELPLPSHMVEAKQLSPIFQSQLQPPPHLHTGVPETSSHDGALPPTWSFPLPNIPSPGMSTKKA